MRQGWMYIFLVLGLSTAALGAASRFELTYTFRLTDRQTGAPMTGPIDLDVAFFHEETDTDPVYKTKVTAIGLQDGVGQVILSFAPDDYQTVFPSVMQPVWIQITDLTHAPGDPYTRQRFAMAPYASKVPVQSSVLRFNNQGELSLSADPVAGKFLKADGSGALVWADPPAGASSVDALFTSSSAAVSPLIVKGAASQAGDLQEWQSSSGTALAAIGADGALKFKQSDSGSHTVALKAPAGMTQDSVYVLPAVPVNGKFLMTDATGHLSWDLPTAGVATEVPAAGIQDLTEGSVPFAVDNAGLSEDNTNFFWDNTAKRLGIGTALPNSRLQVAGPIATAVAAKSAAYSLTASDSVVTADATSAAFDITLPTAASITGRRYTVKKTDSSAHAVTLKPFTVETIDGAASFALTRQNDAVSVISDGASWFVDTATGTVGGTTVVNTTGSGTFSQLTAHGSTADIATNSAGTSLTFSNAGASTIVASNAAGSLGLGVNGATSALQIKAGNTKTSLNIEGDKIGIGTTATPGSELEIRGSGTSSATSALNVTKSNGVSTLFVRDDGNVGIATSDPHAVLDLGAGSGAKFLLYGTGGTPQYEAGLGINLGQSTNAMGFFIGHQDTFTVEAATAFENFPYASGYTTRFVVDGQTGNVGIGTPNPSQKLDVNGNIVLQDGDQNTSSFPYFEAFDTSIGTYVQSYAYDGYFTTNAHTTDGTSWASNNTNYGSMIMRLRTDLAGKGSLDVFQAPSGSATFNLPSPSFTLDTTGNVGIGTTNPATKLDVNGTVSATGLAVSGSMSSPGVGSDSEKFGSGATAAGNQGTAFGYNAAASGDYGTALGYGANASLRSTALGQGASTAGNYAEAIGFGATGAGTYTIATGYNANASGSYAIAIGAYSSAPSTGAVALGYGATATNMSIATGLFATATAAHQFVAGSGASGFDYSITDVYFGKGVSDAAPLPYTIHGTAGNGAGVAGASVGLAGGLGGTAADAGGDVVLSTAAAGTGTTLSERMRIASNGKVGIGTTSPAKALDIAAGSDSSAEGLLLEGARSISFRDNTKLYENGGLVLDSGDATRPIRFLINNTEKARIDTTGNVGIGTISPSNTLHVAGSVCVKDTGTCSGSTAGTIYVTNAVSTGADLAEHMPVDDEALAPGDVVAIEDSGTSDEAVFTRSSNAYQTNAVGVISTAPGISLGSDTKTSRPVALAGRVPVNVTLEGGPIAVGDYLVAASTPGKAMKAADPTRGGVIGVALSAYSGAEIPAKDWGDGIAHEHGRQVLMLVQHGAGNDAAIAALKADSRAKDGEIAQLKAYICAKDPAAGFCSK